MARPRKHEPAAVLTSAMEVFWKKGYVATSMSDIYEATGLKPGNLYKTFLDKEGLFRAAFNAYSEHFRLSLPSNVKGLSAIKTWLDVQVRLATEDPDRKGCLIVNTVTERNAHAQETQDLADARLRDIRAFFERHLALAKDRGELPGTLKVDIWADSLLGAVVAIMSLARAGASKATISNVADQAWNSLAREK